MNLENRIWQALFIFVSILTCAVPIYVTYDLFHKGPIPKKKIILGQFGIIDPMSDLSPLGEKVRLSLEVDDETVDNLVISKSFLRNAGNSPIIPDDYHENISVSVPDPWRIVAVKSPGGMIELTRNKVTDTRFEAQPALLNPGDQVSTTIYLTNTKFKGLMDYDVYQNLKVKWNARITNLRYFSKWRSPLDEPLRPTWRGIVVHLSSWALPFTLMTAVLFLCLYLYLLFKSALLTKISYSNIPVIAAFSLLSFSSAEVIAYYLFDPFPYYMKRYASEWINWVIFAVHVIAITYLYKRMMQHQRTKIEPRD